MALPRMGHARPGPNVSPAISTVVSNQNKRENVMTDVVRSGRLRR
jgi:hypothetical protein